MRPLREPRVDHADLEVVLVHDPPRIVRLNNVVLDSVPLQQTSQRQEGIK